MPYKDPEKQRAWYRARELREREARNAARSARYWADRDNIRQRLRTQRRANPAAANEASKKWRHENYSKSLSTRRAYVARNKARVNENYRRMYATNRVRILLAKQLRRALLAGAHGNVAEPEWAARVDELSSCCAYCLRATEKLGMDHQVPLGRRGPHRIDNVVPACRPCNSRKRDKSVFSMLRTDGVDPWYGGARG